MAPSRSARPPRHQGVLRPLSGAALFLVLTVDDGGEDVVRDLLPDVIGLRKAVSFRAPQGDLDVVTGIGSDLWDRLFSGPRPRQLHPFVPLDGGRHSAPSTPGDLLFHIRAATADLCFELGSLLVQALGDAVTVVDETHGFRYFDQRDLLGFVDGTENPEDQEAYDAVLVDERDPDFVGSSYVVVQKYLHDLDAWNAISVAEQELAMGRRKLNDVELSDDEKPANSHVALTDLPDKDGRPQEIMRDNMPFGSVGAGEFGTYFIGYAGDLDVTELMLRNMFLGDPPGTHDRILDFSIAHTGNVFFCPTLDFLDDPPGPPTESAPPPPATATPAPDGSLGIGNLRRSTS